MKLIRLSILAAAVTFVAQAGPLKFVLYPVRKPVATQKALAKAGVAVVKAASKSVVFVAKQVY